MEVKYFCYAYLSLIFESLDIKVKALMIPTNTIKGNIYKFKL